MKIVDVKLTHVSYPAPTNLRWGRGNTDTVGGIIVQMLTDEGITGLGEFEGSYPVARHVLVTRVLPLIRGEDPRNIERLWESMDGAIGTQNSQMLGGLDVALWDIMGKATGQPVSKLLGGYADRVMVYIAPSMKQPEAIADECARFRAQGYRAIKLRIGLGQVGLAEPGDMSKDYQIVESARRVLGADFAIGVDTDRTYDHFMALKMAERLRELNAAWFEEPLVARGNEEYVREMKRLSGLIRVPLSGGQGFHTRFAFGDLISQRAVDIVQPDCDICGGISEMRRIAAIASVWNLQVMPHVSCGCGYDIRVVATLHVMASITNAMYLCYPAYDTPLRTELLKEPPRVVDGYLEVPQKPGLGIEIDEEALARYSVEE
jgi:D-galactarolactone cycloisomerase